MFKVYYENKATISIYLNPLQYDRIKHAEVDRVFNNKKVENGVIYMIYILTKE